MINKYRRIFCTNFKSILHYIAKYCFKVETKSLKLKVIVQRVLFHVSSKIFMLSFASRLMNKLIAKKNWNTQTICHYLLKRKLTHSSKMIQTLDLRSNVQRRYFFKLELNDVTSNIISLKNIILVLRNKRSWLYFRFSNITCEMLEWRSFKKDRENVSRY
jgi:hypothetical protein